MISWVSSANKTGSDFPLHNLPYGVFSRGDEPRCGVAIGDSILDLAAAEGAGLINSAGTFARPALNDFMALGPSHWAAMRQRLLLLLAEDGDQTLPLVPIAEAKLHLPFSVTEYTDFYASRNHAQTVGTLFRGAENALPPNWLHIPIGYNGRASSVIVSGTPVRRPQGQLRREGGPEFALSQQLDFELELGAVVGTSSRMGRPVSVDEAEEMIFGYVLLNDWSARDIQSWEYQPLGPFQSKAFATSISPWVVTRAALQPFRRPTPRPELPLLPYLLGTQPGLFDIELTVQINGTTVSGTNYDQMYYSSAQQLAHHTSSGCPMRVGDLLGSGTISGTSPASAGSLLELTLAGRNPLALADGTSRTFLADGDTVTLTGHAGRGNCRLGFGICSATILGSTST